MTTAAAPPLPWGRAAATGFVTIIVGITSSVAVVFAAADRMHMTPVQKGSVIFALCVGKGLSSIFLTLRYRVPFLLAWSTPGAALLAASDGAPTTGEYIGAFLLCGVLLLITGLTKSFDRVIDRIPLPLASALLAGVLAKFALESFGFASEANAESTDEIRILIIAMFATYIVARRLFPNFAALAVLGIGVAVAAGQGLISTSGVRWTMTRPTFMEPSWSTSTLIGVGIPLFIVTMAAQNVPGTAALRAHGYDAPVSPAITASGVATTLLAPFGLFAINLAAITAAMVMSPDIDPDKSRRWPATIVAASIYIAVGLLGASIATLIGILPKPLVLAVAAFALLPTIAGGLAGATADNDQRDAAIIVFLVTVSGLTLFSIGSPFWALVAGIAVLAARRIPPLHLRRG
jgi:benzoate membrane transport protein